MAATNERPERFAGHHFPQVIPEPLDVLPGGRAPWASAPRSSRTKLTLAVVRQRLEDASRLLVSSSPPDVPTDFAFVADAEAVPLTRRSAVLLALFEEAGETHVVLTRRAQSLRHHRGEIALPGGRCEEDETMTETALREAHEEVGLDPGLVAPFAWLSPIATFASSSSIWPVVGLLEGPPVFTIDPREVDRAFSVALAELAADGAFVEERWRREFRSPGGDEDGYFPIYFFKVPGDVIWGATARVLTELLCLVTGVTWPPITD